MIEEGVGRQFYEDMMLFLLAFSFLFTMYLYLLSEGDFLFPPFILNLTLMIAALFCIYNYRVWEIEAYRPETAGIVILAVLSFTTASVMVKKTGIAAYKEPICIFPMVKYLIGGRVICMVTLSAATITGMYWRKIYQIGLEAKRKYGGDYPLLWYVRTEGGSQGVGLILNTLSDFTYIAGYIFLYCFINNLIATGKIRKNLKLLLPVAVYLVQTILYGGRTGFLKMMCSAMVCYYYISVKKTWGLRKYRRINRKVLKKFPMLFVGTLLAFVTLSSVSGRPTSDHSVQAGIYTVSVYLGSGLKNLDTFLTRGVDHAHFWGAETFGGIYTTLIRFFGPQDMEAIVALPFQPRLNGLFMGNVYTAVRRYYSDFGITGVILLSALFGAILTFLGKRSRNDCLCSKGNYEARMIVYSWFYYGVIIFWSEDFFYLNGLIMDSVLKIFEVHILMAVMIKRNWINRRWIGLTGR